MALDVRVVVCAAAGALALTSAPTGSAVEGAVPKWSRCAGSVAAAGRSFVVAVDGAVTCATARKAVPPLQRKISSRLAAPGRVVYFAGPPGWKCLAVAEPPAAGRREMSGYCALGIKSFKDPKAKAAFTWLTPFLAKQRLG